MENFINKLLSIDFTNISYLERLKLCKEFLHLCESKIPEKTGYETPKLHLILNEFNKNINSNSINERIYLDRNSFTRNSGYNLVTSMWDIAHECCHGAQQNNVSFNTANRNIPNMFTMAMDHFFDIYAKIERDYDDQLSFLKIGDRFTAKIDIDKKLNDIENFLKSFYWLNPIEREADNFAFSLIEDVIDIAENMSLREEQKARLSTINDALLSKKENLNKQLTRYRVYLDSKEIRENIVNSIRDSRAGLPKNFFSKCKTMTAKEYSKTINCDLVNLQVIIRGLELDYDDDFAHKLFNAIYDNNELGEARYVLLYSLVGYTAIQLTQAEDRKFRQILDEFNATTIDYDTFMKEKAKTREIIDGFMHKKTTSEPKKQIFLFDNEDDKIF